MFVLTTMSTLLAIVIHNLTNINMVERVREISTVKGGTGFLNKEASNYVHIRETVVLSIIGIGRAYIGQNTA